MCVLLHLVFPKILFSIADLFAVRYLWVVCNEDKCCAVTHCAADIRVAWLVYARTYCVPIATLNQNKRTRLLYLDDAQIKRKALILHANENEVQALARLAFYENLLVGQGSSVCCPH